MLDEADYIAKAKAVRTVYSFAAVIMWIRFLYFFRIFRNTGYYIKMLVQVMFDIRYFIFIFVLTIFSFAHAWFIYLKNNEDGPVLVSVNDALKYVYKIALGDFDTEIYGSYYQQISWLFFILATFILQIVLINLLISIVADTFSTIKSNYNVIMY
jgi:Ion transport protein